MLRLVVGLSFALHGLDKLGDLTATELLFASLDIPLPAVLAPFVAVAEIVGRLVLIGGLVTPIAGLALAVDMTVALFTQHIDEGFFVADGGFELVLLLGTASIALALTGAGRLSADAALGLPGHLPAAASWARESIKHSPLRPQAITRGR